MWHLQELQRRREEEQKLIADSGAPSLTPEEAREKGERSVEELLSFIENGGGAGGSGGAKGAKKKSKSKQPRKLSPPAPPQVSPYLLLCASGRIH